MPHTCGECGETYDILSRLRLHDCPEDQEAIERGYDPGSSEHWHWETLYPEFDGAGFDWDTEVRQRLRTVLEECGVTAQLSDDWTFADLLW